MRRLVSLLICLGIAGLGVGPLVSFSRGAIPRTEAAPVAVAAPDQEFTRAGAIARRPGVLEDGAPLAPAARAERRALRMASDRGAVPARLAAALRSVVGRQTYVERVPDPTAADIYIGYDPPAGYTTLALTPTRFVPVVSYWLPISEVTYADLERLFRGEVQDWAELGALRPEPVRRLAVRSDPAAPLAPPAGRPLPDTAALLAALSEMPGGIALVPLEHVDVRLKVLRVDGRDPLLEEGALPGDPLVRWLYIAVAPGASGAAAAWAAELARQQRPAVPEPAIELVVVGDIMPGRLVGRILDSFADYTCPFVRLSEVLSQADLTIANLEGALSNEIAPPTERQTMLFVGDGRFVEGLRYAGIDGVSLANNHSRNFGAAGISHTLALLSEAGVAAFGGGMDLAQARRPALFEVQGVTFAFLGYDAVSAYYAAGEGRAGTVPADPALIAADIAAARAQADVVIPYFHWGVEYTHQPTAQQQALAHLAVESGADLVLGSHPHWVQGLEYYRGAPILYSLGNFVFDQSLGLETRQGVIAHLVFRGRRLVGLRLQAHQIADYYQPFLLPAAEAQEVYRQMRDYSPAWDHAKGERP